MIQTKPLHVRLDKIDGFVRIYDGTRYSTMFGSEKYDAICDGIRHFTSLKWGMTYIFFSLFCKNQNWFWWFFTYRKNYDFAYCYNTY